MFLKLNNTLGEPIQVQVEQSRLDVDGTLEFSSVGNALVALRIRLSPVGEIDVKKDAMIASSDEEIREQFLSNRAEAAISESGGLEYEDSPSPATDTFPYDPETIRVDTKPFNISLVYDMIKDGDINLSPDFQRQFVWTELGTRSRLIESIMLRIPLPVFYMAQDKSGRLQVVDGLQRLTVIKQFLDNDLRLRDLEYLKDEEGKVFRHDDASKCIDQRYRKRILQTQIMVNIIDPQTPTDVKFDIFKRINQGGRPLNAQEIRNCMSHPATRSLISSLATSEEFLNATQRSVGTVRMQDHELVLRFLAFRLVLHRTMEPYAGNMDRFLDGAIDILNSNVDVHPRLAREFKLAMQNSEYLFGEFAFRKCLPQDLVPGARRRLISNSLFTTWSFTLSDFAPERASRVDRGRFAFLTATALAEDTVYLDSVTNGTNDRKRLAYAFEMAGKLAAEQLP